MAATLSACGLAPAAAPARVSQSGPASAVAGLRFLLFRGTPPLQVYRIKPSLRQLDLVVSAVSAGVAALARCCGAQPAWIFRARIQRLPAAEREAAGAVGRRNGLTFPKVVFPRPGSR